MKEWDSMGEFIDEETGIISENEAWKSEMEIMEEKRRAKVKGRNPEKGKHSGRIILLNESEQVESPKLVDAYGVDIVPEKEPYIPCLDGTDPCPPRTRLTGVSKE